MIRESGKFRISKVMILLFMVLFLCGGVKIGITLHDMSHYEKVRLLRLEQPAKNDNLQRDKVQNDNSYTLFTEKKKEEVKNPEFNRKAKVTCIALFGNSVSLFPMGNPLTIHDETGCLISKKTAWELFGDRNVVGKKLIYQEKTYEIRGVLLLNQELFCYEAVKDDKLEFTDLALGSSDNANIREQQSLIQAKYGYWGTWSPLAWNVIPENFNYAKWKDDTDYLRYKENNCIEILYIQEMERLRYWCLCMVVSLFGLLWILCDYIRQHK